MAVARLALGSGGAGGLLPRANERIHNPPSLPQPPLVELPHGELEGAEALPQAVNALKVRPPARFVRANRLDHSSDNCRGGGDGVFAIFAVPSEAKRCEAMRCEAMRCDAMRCDAMRCDAMRCDAMRCDAMRCDAMRCDAMRCDAMRQSFLMKRRAKTNEVNEWSEPNEYELGGIMLILMFNVNVSLVVDVAIMSVAISHTSSRVCVCSSSKRLAETE